MDDEGMPGGAPRQDQLLEEASLWFARMRGPDADRYRPAFDRWMARGAAQRGAYNRAGEVFALGKFMVETPDLSTIAARNALDPWLSRKQFVLAACLLLALGLGGWLGRDLIFGSPSDRPALAGQPSGAAPDFERVSADQGQRRALTLADGSRLILEPGSILGTRFTAGRRDLRLERGRARFEVAHETRPFVVFAGGGSVTARGTIFEVSLDAGNEVTVHLLRGAIDVTRPDRQSQAGSNSEVVARLAPGETLQFAALPGAALADLGPTGAVTRTGDMLDFDKVPLSQVVAQASQGSVAIRLADPSIGTLEVSGRFRIDDPEQLAERLAALLNLRAERIGTKEIRLEKQ